MMRKHDLPPEIEAVTHAVIGCAIEAHRMLGPGLLEGIYEDALIYECGQKGLHAERQVEIAVAYKDTVLRSQRIDVLVNGLVIVEIKSVSKLLDVHSAQLLSYLRAANKPVGLLFNFNVTWLREGMDRVFNERWLGFRDQPNLTPGSPGPCRPPRSPLEPFSTPLSISSSSPASPSSPPRPSR